uniref:Carboxylesterase type B domain-containing protein n=1 Tax=Ditylenchus dipsaci TaxID=166011 RepID=A0A915E1N4_9BILA
MFSLPIILLLNGLALYVKAQTLEKSRSVWVEQGLVRGKIYKIGDQQVQIFRGIPYAEAPVGQLRFKKPIKKARWDREFSATEYGSPCIQFMDFHKHDKMSGENMLKESEDCLFLNIFAPYNSEDESQLFPILVWIHGGSFLAGSSDTGIDMETVAKNLVFKNITIITVNYRLDLSDSCPSIIPTMDRTAVRGIHQQMVKWKRNIKQFNGDPTRITVMGESAGAAAASVLGLSPLTKSLVHQVIAMSGSSTAGW